MSWLTTVGVIIAILSGLLAIAKVLIERILLPSVQFDIYCKKLGRIKDRLLLDIKIQLRNVGSSTLVARNMRLDIRYILTSDFKDDDKDDNEGENEYFENQLFKESKKDGEYQKVGRLYFPNSLIKKMNIDPLDLMPDKVKDDNQSKEEYIEKKFRKRGFLILENDSFVQPGVNQSYNFTTTVPKDSLCVLTWSSFQYAHSLSPFQQKFVNIMKKLNLIRHTLQRAKKPHTVESVCWIADDVKKKIK